MGALLGSMLTTGAASPGAVLEQYSIVQQARGVGPRMVFCGGIACSGFANSTANDKSLQ